MVVSLQVYVSALHGGHHQVAHVRVEKLGLFSPLLHVQPDDGHHEGPKHVVAS
jgi:hypothetical protein